MAIPATADAQLRREAPTALTDAEFWELVTSLSERGGTFLSENFTSNEMTFQHVIPSLQRSLTKDGVYLGVGPEQNFTYIANLKPRMAIIFDIRRQNAMLHLLYKALFELSATRAEFLSRLFSRPDIGRMAPDADPAELFAGAGGASPNDSAYRTNLAAVFKKLVDDHRFALSKSDSASIEHVFTVFFESGPDINYGSRIGRSRTTRSSYATYEMLQTAMNADSVRMAFLASETNYLAVRDLQLRNLIVPVVGDFAGPKAIRAVGEYLKERRLTVTAFYTSNVEQYLYQNGVAAQFYENVSTLPIDSTSTFIRSVPGGGGAASFNAMASFAVGPGFTVAGARSIVFSRTGPVSVTITTDSTGQRRIHIVEDSAGQRRIRNYRDSAGALISLPDSARQVDTAQDSVARDRLKDFLAQQDSLRQAPVRLRSAYPNWMAMGGGGLTSGIMSIRRTLAEHAAGRTLSYQDVIAMTKTRDWK